jgi:hypothetical protein
VDAGTHDPKLNLIFWGIGNPNHVHAGAGRMGANLWTDCIVALNPRSEVEEIREGLPVRDDALSRFDTEQFPEGRWETRSALSLVYKITHAGRRQIFRFLSFRRPD